MLTVRINRTRICKILSFQCLLLAKCHHMNTAYCIDGPQGDPGEYTYYICSQLESTTPPPKVAQWS